MLWFLNLSRLSYALQENASIWNMIGDVEICAESQRFKHSYIVIFNILSDSEVLMILNRCLLEISKTI